MSEAPSQPPANAAPSSKSMDDIMSLCKRRGFIYQASEIYGGINGFWDYGPLGAQLKKNLRDAWWEDVVMLPCWGRKGPDGERVEMVPLDSCIIQHPKVWEASGHVAGFNDPMVDDKETKGRFRADHLYGVFVALYPGASESDKDAVIRRVIEEIENGLLPVKTLIAAGDADACEALDRSKKLLKPYELHSEPKLWPVGGGAVLVANGHKMGQQKDQDSQRMLCVVAPVPMQTLSGRASDVPSPFSGKAGSLTPPRPFNLMFPTIVGATGDWENDKAYLRPETAQGIFVNFKNVVDTTRVRVPFGIAQTGKAFRNEVTPRNFTYRSREFEQMEIEFFCHESEARDWYAFWRDWRMEWWRSIGLAGENLQLREHDRDELAHYAKEGAGTSDIEYRFPFTAPGFGELEGIAHRTDFDLRQHQTHARVKLEYNDTERGELLPNGSRRGERYLPHVIEPSAGLDRGVLALLCEAYTRDESRPSPEFLKLHPRVAPIKAAVFPLVNKDGMPEVAEKLHTELVRKFGRLGGIETDAKQSIGKRYARMDEAGCPFCFTVDGDTLKDGTVTVRDRDTGSQERIAADKVSEFLRGKLGL